MTVPAFIKTSKAVVGIMAIGSMGYMSWPSIHSIISNPLKSKDSIYFHTCKDKTSIYADYTNKQGHKYTRVFCYMCGKKRRIGSDYEKVPIDPKHFDVMTATQLIANTLYFKSIFNRIFWNHYEGRGPAVMMYPNGNVDYIRHGMAQPLEEEIVNELLKCGYSIKDIIKVDLTRNWVREHAIKQYEMYQTGKDIIKLGKSIKVNVV